MSSELVARLRSEVAGGLARSTNADLDAAARRDLAQRLLATKFEELARHQLTVGQVPMRSDEEDGIARAVLDALFGLGRLQQFIDDPDVENIDVNGADQVWVTYFDGTKEMVGPAAGSDNELVETIRGAASRFGLSERRFDTAHPELDLRLPDGSRLSALMEVSTRPALSIRRHRFVDLSLGDLVGMGLCNEGLASLLGAAVKARKNVVVAGAMNAGKTTLVRALASEIPPEERIVTIEQAFELALDTMPERHRDIVALEAREANAEGEGEITMARLVRRALRMNAERVIVGEVLGAEVIPMLNAMSQGRSGSMCTIHADSSAGVFRRVASYAVQAPERLPLEATNLLVAGSIHLVVFLDLAAPSPAPGALTHPAARTRVISSVREVVDAEGIQVVSNEVFRPGPDRRAQPAAPLRTRTLEELTSHGYRFVGRQMEGACW